MLRAVCPAGGRKAEKKRKSPVLREISEYLLCGNIVTNRVWCYNDIE